jgi:hypothetical protein
VLDAVLFLEQALRNPPSKLWYDIETWWPNSEKEGRLDTRSYVLMLQDTMPGYVVIVFPVYVLPDYLCSRLPSAGYLNLLVHTRLASATTEASALALKLAARDLFYGLPDI